jgi:segregation and condensation protein B
MILRIYRVYIWYSNFYNIRFKEVLNRIKYNYILLMNYNEVKMKIVATPMCKDVMRLAGVKKFHVSSDPDSTDAEIAVVLSETNTVMKSVKLKLNTFLQIKDSVEMLRDMFGIIEVENLSFKVNIKSSKSENRKIKVRVYSNFLRDIVDDLGFSVVSEDQNYDYLVYPDYFRDKLSDEIVTMGDYVVEVPTHKNAPKNPVKRAEMRYKLLEKKICMKP